MFKMFKQFVSPNPTALATQLLVEAKLDSLKAQAAKEYWQAHSSMLEIRIMRLQKITKTD